MDNQEYWKEYYTLLRECLFQLGLDKYDLTNQDILDTYFSIVSGLKEK